LGGMSGEMVPEILTNSRFYLELSLDGSSEAIDAVFLECKGFKYTQDIIEACEVTPYQWAKASRGQVVRTKVPGNVKTNQLVLRRGLSASMTIWNWFDAVQSGNWSNQRRNGSLSIYNQAAVVQARFEFSGGWPSNYMIADVNAGGSEIEIEELEVTIEEFKRVR
jgi:phage tail-like protein